MSTTDWQDALLKKRTRTGDVVPTACSANAALILHSDPLWSGVLAWDEFRGLLTTTRPPPWDETDAPPVVTAGPWTDEDTTRTAHWILRHYGLALAEDAVYRAVRVASRRRPIHPVRDWLGALKWDGRKRVDDFFTEYFGATDSYAGGVSSRFLIGAVARIYKPGCKLDTMPILDGKQGLGKSSGMGALFSLEWSSDTCLEVGSKDAYQSLVGKWAIEIGELQAFSRADHGWIKAFLTSQVDSYRPSYGREQVSKARQTVFYGTSNPGQGSLSDETGGRRFWPVSCRRVDVPRIRSDRDQLWAEAVVRYLAGEAWHVDTEDFRIACEAAQEAAFQTEVWEDPIAAWLKGGTPERRTKGATMGEIMHGALDLTTDKQRAGDARTVGKILRRLGWDKKQEMVDGVRLVRWRPVALPKLIAMGTTISSQAQYLGWEEKAEQIPLIPTTTTTTTIPLYKDR